MPPEVAERLSEHFPQVALTPREIESCQLLNIDSHGCPLLFERLRRFVNRLARGLALSVAAVGATRSLYLKELYVPDAHRRRGVGTLLMRAIFETADTLGCSRVEWTTDAGNIAAQAFYAKLGLPAHPSKVFYRVEDTGSGLRSIVPGRVS